ncbi:MAG: hypothetical protein RQM90_07580 [Methanoculleus sp.]
MVNEDLAAQVTAPFEPIQELIGNFVLYVPSIIAAIIILIIGWILGRVIGKIVAGILNRIGVDSALRKTSVGAYIEQSGAGTAHLFGSSSAGSSTSPQSSRLSASSRSHP